MKTYKGYATTSDRPSHVVVEQNGRRSDLTLRLDIRHHSPTGFSWGYSGSGPAQLALALCADVLRDDTLAEHIYQRFKQLVISKIPAGEDFELREEDILETTRAIVRDS